MENNHHDDDLQPGNDDTLLARWLAGDLSPEDLEALRNLEGYPEYVEMLAALEGLEMDEYSPTLAWQKLQPILEKEKAEKEVGNSPTLVGVGSAQSVPAELETTAETPEIAQQPEAKIVEITQPSTAPTIVNRKSQILNRQWLAIAATVLLGVVGIWWFSSRDNFSFTDTAYQTNAGENKEVKLPDGSVVTLNAMSKLGFAEADWTEGRKVALDGEAYFKAKKGKTFTVQTEQGSVQVVGTIFNVYARGEELEVKCAEGKVQVTNPEATERVLLKKGEQVTVLRGRMQQRQGLSFYPNWFKGESTFRSASLERVFGEMERQYGVKVLADSLGERTFSGKFVNNDLKKAVKMVCDPMKLNCEVRGDTVVIH
ncbi:MAG: FecR domain-containing protein [Saprospiraceae bacterium]|nr:FecR domain-containing protein [Saprospiraceae bacterium]MCF8248768.1 FecR domain-containing protein [Saprospiraceae bacterium]MCF8278742.1 FecR domain-containing protein [Bacteroidales bacterium]MCF8310542.1 FecR domain-containing protein [Saprospiraceae bacterium]MCF8439101.1 FecR domain-containing protein [Saprospiraceae bacterium]